MTEMEMVKELRRVVAAMAGQAGGNREAVKAEIRTELVSMVKERELSRMLPTVTMAAQSW